jgi:hypothetical protein
LDGVNQFACELEAGLVNMAGQLEATESQMAAARQLMTDPNLLAQYVMEFYGPEGPYPVDEAKEQLAAMQQSQQFDYNYRQEPSYDPRIQPDGAGLDSTTSRLVDPIGYQRPSFPAPPQSAGAGQNVDISMLGQAYQQNPAEAWKIVDYLQNAGAFRGTVLAMDS